MMLMVVTDKQLLSYATACIVHSIAEGAWRLPAETKLESGAATLINQLTWHARLGGPTFCPKRECRRAALILV